MLQVSHLRGRHAEVIGIKELKTIHEATMPAERAIHPNLEGLRSKTREAQKPQYLLKQRALQVSKLELPLEAESIHVQSRPSTWKK